MLTVKEIGNTIACEVVKVAMVFIFNLSIDKTILTKRANGSSDGLINTITETFISGGESTQVCGSRGIFEEVGVFVPPEIIIVTDQTIQTASPSGKPIILHPCYVTIDLAPDELCLDPEEVESVQFVSVENVTHALDFPEAMLAYSLILKFNGNKIHRGDSC